MKRYSKLIIAAIIALIFIGTFVFLWQKSQPKEVVYNEFTPKMEDIQKTTIITGKIEPRNEVNVKPQISGIITELLKEPGQTVQQGEVIAKVKVIPDMGQLSSAEARVRLSEINLKQAQVNFNREENLYNQKLVSADEYDKVKQALHQAKEEKTAAEDGRGRQHQTFPFPVGAAPAHATPFIVVGLHRYGIDIAGPDAGNDAKIRAFCDALK